MDIARLAFFGFSCLVPRRVDKVGAVNGSIVFLPGCSRTSDQVDCDPPPMLGRLAYWRRRGVKVTRETEECRCTCVVPTTQRQKSPCRKYRYSGRCRAVVLVERCNVEKPGSPRRRVHEEGARPTPSVAGSPGRRPMAGVRLGLKDQGSGTSLQTCGRVGVARGCPKKVVQVIFGPQQSAGPPVTAPPSPISLSSSTLCLRFCPDLLGSVSLTCHRKRMRLRAALRQMCGWAT